jgi:hypothetical protein
MLDDRPHRLAPKPPASIRWTVLRQPCIEFLLDVAPYRVTIGPRQEPLEEKRACVGGALAGASEQETAVPGSTSAVAEEVPVAGGAAVVAPDINIWCRMENGG